MRLTLENEDKELQSVFQEEKILFRDLSFSQKLKHLWIYHKWKFLLPLMAIVIGVTAFVLSHSQKDTYLMVSYLNSTADFTSYADIQEDFAAYAGVDLDESDIIVEALVSDFSTREQIAVKFFAETVDVILCDETSFSLYYENGCFAPLEDYIPKDYFQKYPFEPLTYYNKEDMTEHIYGIVLKDNDLLRKYYPEPPVFAISLNAPHKEASGLYLQYLLEMQKDYTR